MATTVFDPRAPAPGQTGRRHELLNALTAATAIAQLLEVRVAEPECDRDSMAAICLALRRMAALLSQAELIDRRRPIDLWRTLEEGASQIPPPRGADVVLTCLTDHPMVSVFDEDAVIEVLTNLFDNAAKYSPPGTPIHVELCQHGEWARVAISDHGIGVEPDMVETIFLGQRTVAARTTARGSGIGLQLSRRLAESQGGRLWLSSVRGLGSTFYLDLPLVSPGPHSAPAVGAWPDGAAAIHGQHFH
jgi:signal transduction histidine kinase